MIFKLKPMDTRILCTSSYTISESLLLLQFSLMADIMTVIPATILRNLAEKLYEKRKSVALEVEGIVKQLTVAGDHDKINAASESSKGISELGYTKTQEERLFRGSIKLEVINMFEKIAGPLSLTGITGSLKDGAGTRVAYQGVSGAYSESAAEKAYPNCESVPCEQFDIAFQTLNSQVTTAQHVERDKTYDIVSER